jgi:hypothetical protein
VKQREQEVLHAQDSVRRTSGATQPRLTPRFRERIGNSRRTGWIVRPRRTPSRQAEPDGPQFLYQGGADGSRACGIPKGGRP